VPFLFLLSDISLCDYLSFANCGVVQGLGGLRATPPLENNAKSRQTDA
jgi:hypothetical protein